MVPRVSARRLRGLRGDAQEARGRSRGRDVLPRNVLHQSVDTLSKGYRHRTCFAQSIIHDPDVLILDEPTDGLDPNQKHEVRKLIRRMGEKKAIIFSTHILEEVEAVCSRAIIIDRGQIVANGTPAELQAALRRRGRGDAARARRARRTRSKQRLAGVTRREQGADREGRSRRGLGAGLSERQQRATANWRAASPKLACSEGWKLEELHTEEGRLDEVFRSITLPDTQANEQKQVRRPSMNDACRNIKTIAKRELSGYFASPVAYVFIVIFLLLIGFFTFMVGRLLRARRGVACVPFFSWHPWLYLFLVPAVGMRLWSEERRLGTHRTAAHHADHGVAGDRREIPRLVAVPRARAGADLSRS